MPSQLASVGAVWTFQLPRGVRAAGVASDDRDGGAQTGGRWWHVVPVG